MILLLIVGSVFFTAGLMIIFSYIRFKRIGERVQGRVRAIEQYISIDSDKRKTTMYKPIVDYHFRGEPRIVIGISTSTSNIAHKPKQDVNVLVIEEFETGKITARIDSNGYLILGSFFLLMGLAAVLIYADESAAYWVHAQISLTIAILIAFFIPKFLRPGITAGEDKQTISDEAVLIATLDEYKEIVNKGKTAGYVIAFAFLVLGLVCLYSTHITVSGSTFTPEEFQSTFSSFEGFKDRISSGRLSEKWRKLFAIGGIGVFLTLTSTYSLLRQFKKYRNI